MTSIPSGIPVQYDAATHTYRLEYDWWHDYSVTTAIVMAIAAITNTPQTDVELIAETLNPDALNNLYAPSDGDRLRREDGYTTFNMHGCNVTIYANGDIDIEPPDELEQTGGPLTTNY